MEKFALVSLDMNQNRKTFSLLHHSNAKINLSVLNTQIRILFKSIKQTLNPPEPAATSTHF